MKLHQKSDIDALGIVFTVLIGLAGCTAKEPAQLEPQVAARVNAEEISMGQLGGPASRSPEHTVEFGNSARIALDRLVDRELLVQQAEKHHVDRNPQVVQTLDSVRKDVIAKAYLDSLTAQLQPPNSIQIKQFYDANPALFSHRQIYTLRQLSLTLPVADRARYLAEIESVIADDDENQSLQNLKQWVHTREIVLAESDGVKAAEELPIDMLSKFAAMKAGDVGYLRNENGLLVFQVLSVIDSPMSEQSAKPLIENILMNAKKADLVAAEMKRLRETAHIEYLGGFSDIVAAADASGKQSDGKTY